MFGMRLGIEPALGQREVAGGIDELLELRVRHLVTVDPEAVDADDVGEALLGLMALGAHLERAAGNERHAGGLAFPGRKTGVGIAAPDLGRCWGRLFDADCEGAHHDAGQRHDRQRNQRGEAHRQP